jgi:hypothetical protein
MNQYQRAGGEPCESAAWANNKPWRFALALLPQLCLLGGCSWLPAYVLGGSGQVPAGPKVASLIANMKCSLWHAANSDEILPWYNNNPALLDGPNATRNRIKTKEADKDDTDPLERGRAFTLHNMLQEIEYVGEATLTLEVTNTGAFNPSFGATKYYSGTIEGDINPTMASLAVAGTYSDAADRFVTLEASIDFSRMVPIEREGKPSTSPATDAKDEQNGDPYVADPFNMQAPAPTKPAHQTIDMKSSCASGSDLQGDLKLVEPLGMGLVAASMNDIQALANADPSAGPATDNPTPSGNEPISAVSPAINVPSYYAFGQITTQLDFTVIENVNGGPTWTLQYIKFPGQATAGLLNANRQVKDTLILTFIPVCIREKYWTNSTSAPYEYKSLVLHDDKAKAAYERRATVRQENLPPTIPRTATVEMVEGTPVWANFLPPCDSPGMLQARVNAVGKASLQNYRLLPNSNPNATGIIP